MQGRRRKRILSEDERELWERVTRRDEPLTRPLPQALPDRPALPEKQNSLGEEVARAAPLPPAETPAKTFQTKIKPVSEPPLPAPFDPKVSKRLARGHRDIDARLDLHGLRQQDAYAQLRRFLARAQELGHRHVLIITGKGKGEADSNRDFWNSEERGVLRRLVPQWLCEPALRLHAVSFTESALKHGGSGALYVTIRKSARTKG